MTPQELAAVEHLLQCAMEHGYRQRQKEFDAGKPMNTEQFKLNRAGKLNLQTYFSKIAKRR